MTAPETLAERLAKCVLPLEWAWDEASETYFAYCSVLARDYEATGDTRHTVNDARSARILAALDMDAIARMIAEAVEAAYDDARKAVLALDTCEDAPDHLSYNTAVLRAAERIRAAAIRARSEGGA